MGRSILALMRWVRFPVLGWSEDWVWTDGRFSGWCEDRWGYGGHVRGALEVGAKTGRDSVLRAKTWVR